jgi:hypothetical protein
MRCEFAYDAGKHFLLNTSYIMPTDEEWLLGILNSEVVFWFYTHICNSIQGGFVRFIRQYVEQIPIPNASLLQQVIIGKLCDYVAFWTSSQSALLKNRIEVTDTLFDFLEALLNGLV